MLEGIQTSREYVAHQLGWIIDESTFRIISEHSSAWVARVTATRGDASTFCIFVQGKCLPLVLDHAALVSFTQWGIAMTSTSQEQ